MTSSPRVEQGVDEVGADEAGAAGHERAHAHTLGHRGAERRSAGVKLLSGFVRTVPAMSLLRTLPTRRLLALLAAVVVIAAGGPRSPSAPSAAAGRRRPPSRSPAPSTTPSPRPTVDGITARITFTNKLIDSASLQGGDPLLTGAKGRLWLGDGGKLRLELQTDSGGDAQIVSDGTSAWVYRLRLEHRLPRQRSRRSSRRAAKADEKPPTLAEVQTAPRASSPKTADLSGATPGNVAGRPAYTVRISPKHDGGLLGGGELAWDAAQGRAAARRRLRPAAAARRCSSSRPTDICFGKVRRQGLRDLAAGGRQGRRPRRAERRGRPVPSTPPRRPSRGVGPVSKAAAASSSSRSRHAGRPAPQRGPARRLEGRAGGRRHLRPGPRRRSP